MAKKPFSSLFKSENRKGLFLRFFLPAGWRFKRLLHFWNASVNAGNASSQKLKVIDEPGHIQKEVKESGEEATPILSLSVIGWLFLCLDVISGIALVISVLSVIKKKQNADISN